MSGESETVTQDTQVSHTDAKGRTLSGMGADVEKLAETMERHAPEPAADRAKPAEPAPAGEPAPSRGRQRFADLTREREEARAETAKERAARETLEREVAELRAKVTPPAAAPAKRAEAPKREKFVAFDAWLAKPENAAKMQKGADGQPTEASVLEAYNDWLAEFLNHGYEQRRAAERDEEKRTSAERDFDAKHKSYVEKLPEARKKYADYDAVIAAAPKVAATLIQAVIDIGPDAAYWLAAHPDEATALSNETAVDPENPAFAAAVAANRRYLSSVVNAAQPAPDKPRHAWTPPPAPHPSIGGAAPTNGASSAELAKKGDFDGFREQRAKERGVKTRFGGR